MKPGDVFGRLTVVRLISDGKNPKAECVCNCGTVVTPQRGSLRNGRAQSCGCQRRERLVASAITHGGSGSPEYSVFLGMKDRCANPNNPHFHNYGGRGIRVLYDNFEAFLADLGPRPLGAWIDRLHNDRHYEPGNCRWVSPSENQKNKRVSKWWFIDGQRYESSVDAAKALGVTPSVIVRGCNGYTRNGRHFPPRPGWSSQSKYPLRAEVLP